MLRFAFSVLFTLAVLSFDASSQSSPPPPAPTPAPEPPDDPYGPWTDLESDTNPFNDPENTPGTVYCQDVKPEDSCNSDIP